MFSPAPNPERLRFLFLPLAALTIGGCSSEPDREVVLYSSIDESYSRRIARRFEQDTGITVKLVSDTEATKSTGLLNRLIAEKQRPVADVFLSGDIMRAAILRRHEIAAPYQTLTGGDLPSDHSDPNHAFTGFSGRLRLIIYHTQGRKDRPIPSSVLDLAKPEFASHSCLANPLFGTTSMHAAVLFETVGEDRAKKFFEDFSAHGGRMLASNGEVKRRVSSGEFTYGLTDSDDISVALFDRKPVGFIIPDQGEEQGGAVLIPSAAVLIRKAPHPEEARRLIDFLVSAEVETLMAESVAAHFPLRATLNPPEPFGVSLEDVKVTPLNYEKLAAQMATLQDGFLRTWVAGETSR